MAEEIRVHPFPLLQSGQFQHLVFAVLTQLQSLGVLLGAFDGARDGVFDGLELGMVGVLLGALVAGAGVQLQVPAVTQLLGLSLQAPSDARTVQNAR